MSYWQRLEAEKAKKRQEKAERQRQAEQERRERRKVAVNVETLPTAKPAAIAVKERPLLRKDLENRERLTRWFSHPWDAIEKEGDEGWKTLKYPLLPAAIFQRWRDGDRLIGLGFGKEANYFVIDIDSESPYHTEDGLREIRSALESLGIYQSILIQSSFSEGWHLYGFLSEAVPTFALACGLHQAMEDTGLTVGPGVLELFPNRKSFKKDGKGIYNRHRLPLQPGSGSFLLDEDLCPFSDSLSRFLDLADKAAAIANDVETLLEYSELARESFYNTNKEAQSHFFRAGRHSKKVKEWRANLEAAIAQGWTGNHQSNELLGRIAEYGRVFLGLGGVELANYIYKTAIASPGYESYCRHQREMGNWAERWARSAEKYRYPLGTKKGGEFHPLPKAGPSNEERKVDAMERIVEAIQTYEALGRPWPSTIRKRRSQLAEMAGCSERTLAKAEYLTLWHPAHINANEEPIPYPVSLSGNDEDEKEKRDHTPAITVCPACPPSASEKKFITPSESGSDRQDQPKLSIDPLSVLPPSSFSAPILLESAQGETYSDFVEDEQPKNVSKIVTMNHFRKSDGFQVGDRVRCNRYPSETFEIIETYGSQAHLENGWGYEWVLMSELTKLEDNHA